MESDKSGVMANISSLYCGFQSTCVTLGPDKSERVLLQDKMQVSHDVCCVTMSGWDLGIVGKIVLTF